MTESTLSNSVKVVSLYIKNLKKISIRRFSFLQDFLIFYS